MTLLPACIRIAIVLLAGAGVTLAPLALADPATSTGVPIRIDPAQIGVPAAVDASEGYEDVEDGPGVAELKLILAQDMMPIFGHAVMAEFIWQADPDAACAAATASVAHATAAVSNVAALRARLVREGVSTEALDDRMSGAPDMTAMTAKAKARFCDRIVPQNLSADDKAAFKKGVQLLQAFRDELSEAILAKVSGDEARSCVSTRVAAATVSDFEDFIRSEAETSEVMAQITRSRFMRQTEDLREMVKEAAADCAS